MVGLLWDVQPCRLIARVESFRYHSLMQAADVDLKLMHMLAGRLERLSADSAWAHRASGVRGHLLRVIDGMEKGEAAPEGTGELIDMAFLMLREGARELRGKPVK